MMAETHSKTQTSTTTITTTTPTYAPPPKSGISLCLEYFKTGPGIVKLVELVSIYLATNNAYTSVVQVDLLCSPIRQSNLTGDLNALES